MTAHSFQHVSHICSLVLQDWHRGYKGQVKCFSVLLSLEKLLDNQGLWHLSTRFAELLKEGLHGLGWTVMIQAGIILSYSICWTQCGYCSWSRTTPSTSIQAKPKTHSSHRNNQAQKNSLIKEKTQSIQNVSVKCLKGWGLSESMGRAEARSQCAALPCLCSLKLYSPLNPYEALKRQWNTI